MQVLSFSVQIAKTLSFYRRIIICTVELAAVAVVPRKTPLPEDWQPPLDRIRPSISPTGSHKCGRTNKLYERWVSCGPAACSRHNPLNTRKSPSTMSNVRSLHGILGERGTGNKSLHVFGRPRPGLLHSLRQKSWVRPFGCSVTSSTQRAANLRPRATSCSPIWRRRAPFGRRAMHWLTVDLKQAGCRTVLVLCRENDHFRYKHTSQPV